MNGYTEKPRSKERARQAIAKILKVLLLVTEDKKSPN